MSPAAGWFRQRIADASWRARVHTRAWLQRHPRWRRFLARTGSLNVDEFTLARGVAVGLFIGLTPTLGVQTPLMLAASMILRANFPAAFLASWINNPLTFAPLYFGMHQAGEYILSLLPVRFDTLPGVGDDIIHGTSSLVVGSLAIALPVCLLGYLAFLYVWRRFDLHLPARADPAPGGGSTEEEDPG
ncbi:MAG: DUF2062 domain-containing protein [Gammaproteobacteria bacterium]|nr:DUF2062 domain-containing protein [Gammaproteobacteria bacterium]